METSSHQYKDRLITGCSKGPNHAELRAILEAMRSVKSLKIQINCCLIYSDSVSACALAKGFWNPNRSYIREIVDSINNEKTKLEEKGIHVYLFNTSAKYVKRIDRKAKTARVAREKEKDQQISKRLETVKQTIDRSNGIVIEFDEIHHWALSSDGEMRYRVSVDLPYCDCLAWQKKWADKSIESVLARALPCKHMCALCKELGQDVLTVFKKPIYRVD